MKGATTQRSTPHQGGARTSTAPTPARQTTQTTHTRQRRPYGGRDNSEPTKPARHPAGYNTTNRNPNTPTEHSPPRGGGTHQHDTPQQGGGARTGTAPTPAKPTRQPQPQPTRQMTTTQTKHHHRSRRPPTQDAPARGGSRTETARSTNGGATQKHGTPQQRGGTHQQSTNPGQANTTDHRHPTTPAVRRRRQQRTNKTSRASSRPHTNTARPTMGGGHAPTQYTQP